MADWRYNITLKDLFEAEPEDGDHGAHAIKIAPECAKRVRTLISKVEKASEQEVQDHLGNLAADLEEVAEMFDEIATKSDEHEDTPQDMFNDNMAMLYDIGDRWHRVWVG